MLVEDRVALLLCYFCVLWFIGCRVYVVDGISSGGWQVWDYFLRSVWSFCHGGVVVDDLRPWEWFVGGSGS